MTISGFLPFTQAEQGLISLPLIIIHLGILVTDSIWASWWFAWDAKKEKAANKSLANGHAVMLEVRDDEDKADELIQQTDATAHESSL